MSRKLVFLGGVLGEKDWRKRLIADLIDKGIDPEQLFNPVVEDWNEAARANEEKVKKEASHRLFYLGCPKEDGSELPAYSMLEATMALYDHPNSTIVIFDKEGIKGLALQSFEQAKKVLEKRFPDGNIVSDLKEAENWLVKELSLDFGKE